MERKTAHDFDQELLILFDACGHGVIDRRGFLDKAAKIRRRRCLEDQGRALKAANVRYERYQYPGTQHGFNNGTTPRYDAGAARPAWGTDGRALPKYLA